MIPGGQVRFPRPPAWSWSAYAGSARSTPPGSPGLRTRAWSSWSPPSTPVSSLDPPVIYGADLYADLDGGPGRGRPGGCGGGRGAAGRALPAGPHRPHRRRRRLPGEASGDVAGRLHPAARPRAADRTRRPGRFPEPRFARPGDAAGRMPSASGRWSGSAPSGAWSRTVGYWTRSPWSGRRSLRGRPVVDGVVTNPLGARGGDGPGRRRLPDARGRRGGRDRPVPGQRHRLRRHLGGPGADRPGPRRDLRPHPVRAGPARP